MPEIVFAELDEAFGRSEPDEEIQDLLKASTGLNLAMHYLSGAITFDPVVNSPDPLLASQVVWLDGLLTNVDRTARNTNMLIWNRDLWLIDHGASLYFHHNSGDVKTQAVNAFPQVKDHVLLPLAGQLDEVSQSFQNILTDEFISDIVALVPEEWLEFAFPYDAAAASRQMYTTFLRERVARADIFVNEAKYAREALI